MSRKSGSFNRPPMPAWIGLSLLPLLMLSAGCTTPTVAPRHPGLLQPCPRPPLEGESYRDLVTRSLQQDLSLERCNCQLQALRNEPPSPVCR